MSDESTIEPFIRDGFLRLDQAFPAALAAEVRARLWADMPGRPDDPASWTQPVARLGYYTEAPFLAAADTPRLRRAFDLLVGEGSWLPCRAMGSFAVRFPSPEDPGDAGWHVDTSFGDARADFMQWRVNLRSRGRALLMLFLFSDVGADDAPTRLRIGSHRIVARRLAPAGEAGLTLAELVDSGFAETAHCPEIAAVGAAGTVYLCHPFLVHAAQPHRGTQPRFLAQPPLLPARPFTLDSPDKDACPVERAIMLALRES